MFGITLINGKRFDADPQVSILEAARASGLALEHSCRTGRCGLCRTVVRHGGTKLLQPELCADKLESGEILTCCRAAASDLQLEVADLGRLAGIEKRVFPAKIASIKLLTADIAHVTLRLPPQAKFTYLPGQYIDVIAKGVKRSYSIANAPRPDGTLDLYIRQFKNGILSKYWFTEAKFGDLLRFEGPLGTFHLRSEGSGPLIFLATGTGIAPVRALLEETRSIRLQRPILAFWGNREKQDFFSMPLPGDGGAAIKHVLSRPDSSWGGASGYVQDVLLATSPALGDASVYACGSENMIRDAERRLVEVGLPASRFFADPFLSSN